MTLKQRTLIETIDNEQFRIRLIELGKNEEAILTHFLHNSRNGEATSYKDDAFNIVQEILIQEYPSYKDEQKHFGEEALQYTLLKALDILDIPFPSPEYPKFEFIDLFAGIGGFRMALQNLQGKCIYSSEWDKNAKITYKTNFGETPFGDITKEKTKSYIPNNFDILCAGFPCQAFSIAGYQKGFSDTRGTLFFDIEQIISKHKPKVVFLENVKNLVSHDKGRTFKIIQETLEKKLGYVVFYKVLNTKDYTNIPQNRERIFIIAFDPNQVKNYHEFKFPDKIPLTKTIHDFLQKEKQEEKYYYQKDHQYFRELNENMKDKNTMYQWRRVYVRENKNNVCPTLTANMGTGGHNVPLIRDDYGIRKLTPKECFAFQGFPIDKFILPEISNGKLYMQAGNSVTMPLIERIGQNIIEILEN